MFMFVFRAKGRVRTRFARKGESVDVVIMRSDFNDAFWSSVLPIAPRSRLMACADDKGLASAKEKYESMLVLIEEIKKL